jgi:Holliday junction resolvase
VGRLSREKGARGEREVAAIYREHGFDAWREAPLQAGGRGADVGLNVPGLHIEVKRDEKLSIWKALDQVCRDAPAGAIRAVHFRRNRSGWNVALPLEDFLKLLSSRS